MKRRKPDLLTRARNLAIGITCAATLLGACTRQADRTAAPSHPNASKSLSVGEFQLGTRLGPNGAIAPGAQVTVFSPDDTIHVAMRLRDAPAGTTVKVIWKAPSGEALGDETKRLQPGQDYMFFSADAANLPEGTGYHAEITAKGKPVTVLSFDLVKRG